MIQLMTCAMKTRKDDLPVRMITDLDLPDQLISTAKGAIPYSEWLVLEQQRLHGKGIRSEIFTSTHGRVCLIRKV